MVIVRFDFLDLLQEIPRVEAVPINVGYTERLLPLKLVQLFLEIQVGQIILDVQSFQRDPRGTWQCVHCKYVCP